MSYLNNFQRIRDIFRGMFGVPGVVLNIDVEYYNTLFDNEDSYRQFNVWIETDKARTKYHVDLAVDQMIMTILDNGENVIATIPWWHCV